jgi:hypothetical protein
MGVEIGHQLVVLPLFGFLKVWRSLGESESGQLGIFDMQRRYGSALISAAGIYYLYSALS